MQRLPLIPSVARYDFATVLGGTTYVFVVYWDARDEIWYFDLLAEDETPIRHGVAILLGSPLGRRTIDPLFPDGVLVADDLAGTQRDAGFDDMGTRVLVYFLTPEEVAALQPEAP